MLALAWVGNPTSAVQTSAPRMFPPLAADKEAGWKTYATLTEQRIARNSVTRVASWRWISEPLAAPIARRSSPGRCPSSQVQTKQANGSEIDVPDGWVHHWRGAVLLRGARLDQVFRRLQEEVPGVGKGDVIEGRILARDGTRLRTFIKVRRAGRILVAYDFVYNTEHDVVFTRRTPTTGISSTVATKIAEMYHPGSAEQRELAAGAGQPAARALEFVLALRRGQGRRHRRVRIDHVEPSRPVRIRPVVCGRHRAGVDGKSARQSARVLSLGNAGRPIRAGIPLKPPERRPRRRWFDHRGHDQRNDRADDEDHGHNRVPGVHEQRDGGGQDGCDEAAGPWRAPISRWCGADEQIRQAGMSPRISGACAT